MATWLVVLIFFASIMVGVPLYALIGAKVAKYVVAVLCGCCGWLVDGTSFWCGYDEVIGDFPWWMALFFPFILFATVFVFVCCSVWAWVRLIKYVLR